MHIENFKIFSDLVESESFSRAAKLNGITQSAVSQQLRSMERHFNVLIVDRSQKQFRLTQEGRRLYESSKEILHLYERLDCEIQEMRKVISGNIKLSTIYSVGLHELPSYLKTFMQEFPSVNVHVEYRRSNHVYDDVLHNAVDLGVVAFPLKNRQLEVIPFKTDQLVVAASTDHPLAGREDVAVKELEGFDFVGFDKDIPTRKATDEIFREAKISLEPKMEFDNIETVKRAVEINAGFAILPASTVAHEGKKGLICSIPFRKKTFTRPIAIIHRKGRVLTPAMKQFVALLTGNEVEKSDSQGEAASPSTNGRKPAAKTASKK
ncbi:LysR family transcriptional regulator [Puniceicoccus vermicola]|uniref:LysR family transcriptional regulator n=1 Tax=Puniceicoccus vermicola TaxID=388746 RepID=A0A7X1E4C6_9BACT|nr:LysR family transcriptional regulator [Puniceicoccus vermicola]MBC2601909.1 LysR family transcriptional regulator [Puniceicoccus vermicola]